MPDKEFKRNDTLFSLCGLNCSLCPSLVRGNCPGCQAGSHCALTCPFVPCSIEHGGMDYCFECQDYPCEKFDGVDEHDSLISHRNQLKDIQKVKNIGIEKYHEEQRAKRQILNEFLTGYDNGHMDVFFCLAVNLLELDDLKSVLKEANETTRDMSLDKKSDIMRQLLDDCGRLRNIELKLRNDGFYG